MNTQVRRKFRASGLGLASVLALSAASVFGFAAAAQAAYVSPEALSSESDAGWYAWVDYDGEIPPDPTFTSCSIVFPETGGVVGYDFPEDASPTGLAEVSATIESFSVNVTEGGGMLEVLIDRVLAGGGTGIADISMTIPVGIHGVSLDAVVSLVDGPDLGLGADPTVQDVLDALEATGDVYYILGLRFSSSVESAVQWMTFGSETYWFGTDAAWFVNGPTTCGATIPNPAKPVRVETAA